MNTASFILSLFSLVIASVIALFDIWMGIQIERKNKETYYFNKIFEEYLIKEIPKARKYVQINRGKVIGVSELVKVFKSIRSDILYYKYVDEAYYNELKDVLEEFEDWLIDSQEKKKLGESQEEYFAMLKNKMDNLYQIINKKSNIKIQKRKQVKTNKNSILR